MLAATAQSLGTCCFGFAVGALNTPEVKKELGIPDSHPRESASRPPY
ncbi:hypothetical protein [Bradyrhizobium sp. USDA 4452]